jgi:hypothetical protein
MTWDKGDRQERRGDKRVRKDGKEDKNETG